MKLQERVTELETDGSHTWHINRWESSLNLSRNMLNMLNNLRDIIKALPIDGERKHVIISFIEECDKTARRTYEHIIHSAPSRIRKEYKDTKKK